MKLKQTITEAEEVEFDSLDSKQQNQIKAVHKHIGGKRGYIFDGIHGLIVNFEKTAGHPSGRLNVNQLKGLIKNKIRWIESKKDSITVGL